MKRTEYFMHQAAMHQWQQSLNKIKEMRNNFISENSIEKIIDEDINVTIAQNQINLVIKLTYY